MVAGCFDFLAFFQFNYSTGSFTDKIIKLSAKFEYGI